MPPTFARTVNMHAMAQPMHHAPAHGPRNSYYVILYVLFLYEQRAYFSIYRVSPGMPKIKAAGAVVHSILPCAILVATTTRAHI